jgi:hypothetical protein
MVLFTSKVGLRRFRANSSYNIDGASAVYKHLFTIAFAVPAFLLAASGKRLIGVGQMGNDVVDIAATVLEDRQSCTEAIGSDPGMDIIVVKLRFHVKGDNKISLWKDDFTLLSGKDGQRSQPLAPSEIAGHMSLIVTENGVRSASGPSHRPSFGGIGLGGQMGGVGNSAPATQAEAKIEDKSQEPENPVLAVLKEKAIAEKEVTDSEEGLLYFLLDGKPPKPKELTLIYKSSGGRVLLDFK